MVTKYGVEYDLNETNYISERNNMIFYFSSATHKRKFDSGIIKRIEWLRHSMSNRFHIPINADDLACIQWYMMCETRGFHIGMKIGDRVKDIYKPENVGVIFIAAHLKGSE